MTLLAALAAGAAVVLAAAGWASAPARAPSTERFDARPRARRRVVAGGPGAAERLSSARPRALRSRPSPHPRAGAEVTGAAGRVVAVALPVVAAATFGLTAAVVLVVLAVVVRAAAVRRVRRRADRLLDQALPEVIDLLVIAASAGQPVPACLASVAERSPAALRPVLVRAHRRIERGESVAVALTDAGGGMGALGPAVVDALVAAHQTGTPLQPALRRVAAVARDRRSRAAEEAARRLPVTLLFPLVCCVLPAFVLLAVVPLLATSLQSLQP